jgi:hypothetical protein
VSVPTQPDRRLLVAVDMEQYSGKTNEQQYESQQTFQRVMREATQAVGLDRVHWMTQRGGDGELAILPGGTPEPIVVGGLVRAMDRSLREHNRYLVPAARVRLRVAVHEGLVHLDGENGYPGEAVVAVSRLVDAKPLKRALTKLPDAGVGLIVSERIFRDVVSQYLDEVRPERFSRVWVSFPGKGFESEAWIYVPDEDVNQLGDLSDRPATDGDAPTASPKAAPSRRKRKRPTYDIEGKNIILGNNGMIGDTIHNYGHGRR